MTTHVVANASSARQGGGLSYIVSELAAIERVTTDIDLTVISAPWNHAQLSAALECRIVLIPALGARSRYACEQVLPLVAKTRNAILYCPGNFAPLLHNPVAVVLTLQNPNYFGIGRQAPHNRSVRRRAKIALSHASARRASRIVVISRSLETEVLSDLPELADRVRVIQSGAPRWDFPATKPQQAASAGGEYLLSLANDYPHKRLDNLVASWAAAFGAVDDPPSLVMIGDIADPSRFRHRTLARSLHSRLIHTGPLGHRSELRWWIEHAMAMVSASSLEAHPLTPAEAGALGCPLVLSDIRPHREVAGSRALYFASDDDSELIDCLRAVRATPPARVPWEWPVTWEQHATQVATLWTEASRA